MSPVARIGFLGLMATASTPCPPGSAKVARIVRAVMLHRYVLPCVLASPAAMVVPSGLKLIEPTSWPATGSVSRAILWRVGWFDRYVVPFLAVTGRMLPSGLIG